MKRFAALGLLGAVAAALVAAGCGGSDSNNSSNASANQSGKASTSVASTSGMLALGNTGEGQVLVGPNGRTLYLFEKDKGPKSTCSGACAGAWPPLTVTGKPSAGGGIDAAKLSVTRRSDGKSQVVYAGHPLYFFASDTKKGDAKGQGVDAFGAEWYVVSAKGDKVESSSSGSGSSSSSSGDAAGGGSTQGGYHY